MMTADSGVGLSSFKPQGIRFQPDKGRIQPVNLGLLYEETQMQPTEYKAAQQRVALAQMRADRPAFDGHWVLALKDSREIEIRGPSLAVAYGRAQMAAKAAGGEIHSIWKRVGSARVLAYLHRDPVMWI